MRSGKRQVRSKPSHAKAHRPIALRVVLADGANGQGVDVDVGRLLQDVADGAGDILGLEEPAGRDESDAAAAARVRADDAASGDELELDGWAEAD